MSESEVKYLTISSYSDTSKILVEYHLTKPIILKNTDYNDKNNLMYHIIFTELNHMKNKIKELEVKVSKYEKVQSADN